MTVNKPSKAEIMPKDEACRRTGLSVRRLNRAARNGEIPALIVDGQVLVLRAPLELLLSGHPATVGSE